MVPNHARYQLRYTPDSFYIIMTVAWNVKKNLEIFKTIFITSCAAG